MAPSHALIQAPDSGPDEVLGDAVSYSTKLWCCPVSWQLYTMTWQKARAPVQGQGRELQASTPDGANTWADAHVKQHVINSVSHLLVQLS